jgi:hypothetical protein
MFETMNKRILELAIKGLEAERDRIEHEFAELRGRLDGGRSGSSLSGRQSRTTSKPRGGMTPAGRKRLAELMRARWAAKKKVGKR